MWGFVSRVLAHFSNVLLVLDEMPNFPEELQGEKKGVLYLTQYKVRTKTPSILLLTLYPMLSYLKAWQITQVMSCTYIDLKFVVSCSYVTTG